MFELFTAGARWVVVRSQDEARALKHNYIGSEHLLLGLLREQDGHGALVLTSLGIGLDQVRTKVVEIVGEGDEVLPGQIPFTAHARATLEGALKESKQLGHRHIGTEHILLGLVRLQEGAAAKVLLDFGVESETIRTKTLGIFGDPDRIKQVEADALSVAKLRIETQRPAPADGIESATLGMTADELVASLPDSRERAELKTRLETALGAMTVGQLLDAVRFTKEIYLEHAAAGAAGHLGDFEQAARFRDIERRLVKAARAVPPREP